MTNPNDHPSIPEKNNVKNNSRISKATPFHGGFAQLLQGIQNPIS